MNINPDGLTQMTLIFFGGCLIFAIVAIIMKAKSEKIGRELEAYYAELEAEEARAALPVDERTDPAP